MTSPTARKFQIFVRREGPGWRYLGLLLGLVLALGPIDSGYGARKDYAAMRKEMVHTIADDVRETSLYLNKRSLDPRVMAALAKVPRHLLVPESERALAYENHPLPIGHGQTISQPYIVAVMTDMLGLEEGDKVLEVGTGSGYQAAILAEMGVDVFTIEIIEPLAERAKADLIRIGYGAVRVRHGDGYYGWEEEAPFDAIVVTAAASHIPPPLIEQLKPGGRMVIPVGSRYLTQQLVLVTKDQQGDISTRQVLPVLFVPLTGGKR